MARQNWAGPGKAGKRCKAIGSAPIFFARFFAIPGKERARGGRGREEDEGYKRKNGEKSHTHKRYSHARTRHTQAQARTYRTQYTCTDARTHAQSKHLRVREDSGGYQIRHLLLEPLLRTRTHAYTSTVVCESWLIACQCVRSREACLCLCARERVRGAVRSRHRLGWAGGREGLGSAGAGAGRPRSLQEWAAKYDYVFPSDRRSAAARRVAVRVCARARRGRIEEAGLRRERRAPHGAV